MTRHNPVVGMMTQVMKMGPGLAGGGPQLGRSEQLLKRGIYRGVGQWPPRIGDEEAVMVCRELTTTLNVSRQPKGDSLVHRHQAGFVELGLPDQQAC